MLFLTLNTLLNFVLLQSQLYGTGILLLYLQIRKILVLTTVCAILRTIVLLTSKIVDSKALH